MNIVTIEDVLKKHLECNPEKVIQHSYLHLVKAAMQEWSSLHNQSLIDRVKAAEAEVYAVREGAEQWEREYKDCRKILQDIIDAESSDWHRMSMANPLQLPLVLIVAKQFLSKYQHL